jgi:pimeloyl-ACP methyl ester carboxylesterase
MPGYGFSGKPTKPGWDPAHIARAWVVLMKRLGYTKFVAQGGDWGAVITDLMGLLAPPELFGVHTNMPGVFPVEIDQAAFSGAAAPSGLSADEKIAYERLQFVYQKGIAYGFQMGLRPQTLYGIADSPVGLAAYFLDHDARSYELISNRAPNQREFLPLFCGNSDEIGSFSSSPLSITLRSLDLDCKFNDFLRDGFAVPRRGML